MLVSGCASANTSNNTSTNASTASNGSSAFQTHDINGTSTNDNGTASMPEKPVEQATNQSVIVGNNNIYGGGTASMPGTPIAPVTNQYVMVESNMTTSTVL